MLVNLPINSFNLLNQLNLSTFKFYLTGSRYFGYAQPSSDWDFFVQSDGRVEEYLKQKGFKRIPMNPDWIDPITDCVYKHKDLVEVALVSNSDLKKKAQLYIRDFYPNLIHELRNNPKDFWPWLYPKLLHLDKEFINSIESAKDAEDDKSLKIER